MINNISIFIVDDHFMVIEGIRSILQDEENINWLGHSMSASSCMDFLDKYRPDVIFMDISLPDESGIELCRKVKKQYPRIKILGLSTYNQQSVIRDMLKNGASGYLLKNASKDELTDAIASVMKGENYLCMEAAESLQNIENTNPIITKREKEVLSLICNGFTNPEIAERLFISLPTANTHRKSLLQKFGAKNVASLVKMAVEAKVFQ
ncbi:response regulator [Epilithonimonas pallida]|uniref:Two component transcriptional regulator, LuxR family n=1 Tax=Epilithonimonas pallida TaxID=373671 RepID=A0ABY1R7I0_9FLAO|nr:response regulator transcription factor [Epilithonimonas pallida]SMP95833.1 two component transcriptional regulator, LuxR family [Epilithonimonas pallida]